MKITDSEVLFRLKRGMEKQLEATLSTFNFASKVERERFPSQYSIYQNDKKILKRLEAMLERRRKNLFKKANRKAKV